MGKYGLEKEVIEAISTIFSKYIEVEKVVLYGSRAMGTYRNGSDIDLTFYGDKLSLRMLYSIEIEIDDLLTPYMFDLSLFSQIDNEELKEHITRVGKVFYEKSV